MSFVMRKGRRIEVETLDFELPKKTAKAAKQKRTVAHLPKATRTALGKEGAKAAKRRRKRA